MCSIANASVTLISMCGLLARSLTCARSDGLSWWCCSLRFCLGCWWWEAEMVLVPVTILGGLPVIANCWFSGPDYFGEYDAGVDEIYWQKSDGTPGKEISEKVRDRLDKEAYWQGYVTEQASDWLGCNCPTRYRDHTVPGGYRLEGEWSDDYIRLNGDPRTRQALPSDAPSQ